VALTGGPGLKTYVWGNEKKSYSGKGRLIHTVRERNGGWEGTVMKRDFPTLHDQGGVSVTTKKESNGPEEKRLWGAKQKP